LPAPLYAVPDLANLNLNRLTVFAAVVDDVACLHHALDAIDGGLHVGVEILDADRQAVEAQRGKIAYVATIGITRIDLDAVLPNAVTAIGKVRFQRGHKARHARRIEEVGCAAAKVQLQ